ncbi:MAG: hypothetical protein HY360_04125 [Verrucomicrobia bacterium]|nr:hypothetical protein [Verrucomicrobiota bacterium]
MQIFRIGPIILFAASAMAGEVVSIAAGNGHSVALKKDGSVWTWGSNVYGQMGIGTNDTQAHPIPTRVNEF